MTDKNRRKLHKRAYNRKREKDTRYKYKEGEQE